MKRYAIMVFDVGGTLLRLDLDKLTLAFLQAAAGHGTQLDFKPTRTILETLELELPERLKRRPISLEEGYGAGFWDDFYTEGFRRLGVAGDVLADAVNIRSRFQRAEFEALYDDALPALEALAARRVSLGILSNFSPNCEDVLRQVGIHAHFSFFIVSAVVGLEKPDPKIFDLVVRAANRPPSEIVYIGDSLHHDMDGARRAGMDAILVDRSGQYPDYAGLRVTDLRDLEAFARPT